MALMKQENCEDSLDDAWLSRWSNPENEVKSEDIKPAMKREVLEQEKSEESFAIKTDDKFSERTKKHKNRKKKQAHKQPSWVEALKNATLSDSINNLCEYQCPKCNTVFKGRQRFYRHLHKTKHAAVSRGGINNFLLTIVAHQCYICAKRILCDRVTIWSHIQKKHQNCSLQAYCSSMGKTFERLNTSSTCMLSKFKAEFFKNDCKVTAEIGNKCTFLCVQCKFVCHCLRQIRRHIIEKNHGSLQDLKDYVTNAIFHQCGICNQLVLCDTRILHYHLRTKHHLTMPAYKTQMNYKTKTKHFKYLDTQSEYCSELKSVITHIPGFQTAPNLKTYMEPNTLAENQVTKDTGNLSFFQCPVCHKTDMSLSAFQEHRYKEHPSNKGFNFMKCALEARYHSCHICSMIILCDNKYITRHLTKRHKIKLSEYVTNYVLKNGNRAFPTFFDYIKNNKVFESFREPIKHEGDNGLIQPHMISSESEDSDEEK